MNLHNHSIFSDGHYPVSVLIDQGIRSGLQLLGISDHAGTLKTNSLSLSDILKYTRIIKQFAETFKSSIRVLAGIEIDSCINRTPDLYNLPYSAIGKLDYILFEYVSNPYWKGLPLELLSKIRRNIGIPVGLAHPDLQFICRDTTVDKVLDFLESNSIFLELSSKEPAKYRNYPDFFTKLRDRNIFISFGSDTHYFLDDIALIQDQCEFTETFGLHDHLISHLFLS